MSEQTATVEVETPAPAESQPASLFEYARWAHAGPEAEFCEHGEDGQCDSEGHWHAWCRIPNDFQEREIREHALAAKARRVRQLRNEGTDGNEILESSLEELRAEPNWSELAAQEIVAMDWPDDYFAARRQVTDMEDPDAQPEDEDAEVPRLFEHIEDDQARYARLSAQDPSERSEDEFTELGDHIKRYEEAFQEAFEAISKPKVETYAGMDDGPLLELLRRKRIEAQGREEFLHARNVYTWLGCTYADSDGEQHVFENLAALERAPKAILAALRETHSALLSQAQGALGN